MWLWLPKLHSAGIASILLFFFSLFLFWNIYKLRLYCIKAVLISAILFHNSSHNQAKRADVWLCTVCFNGWVGETIMPRLYRALCIQSAKWFIPLRLVCNTLSPPVAITVRTCKIPSGLVYTLASLDKAASPLDTQFKLCDWWLCAGMTLYSTLHKTMTCSL